LAAGSHAAFQAQAGGDFGRGKDTVLSIMRSFLTLTPLAAHGSHNRHTVCIPPARLQGLRCCHLRQAQVSPAAPARPLSPAQPQPSIAAWDPFRRPSRPTPQHHTRLQGKAVSLTGAAWLTKYSPCRGRAPRSPAPDRVRVGWEIVGDAKRDIRKPKDGMQGSDVECIAESSSLNDWYLLRLFAETPTITLLNIVPIQREAFLVLLPKTLELRWGVRNFRGKL
jgi:hypothetical protein